MNVCVHFIILCTFVYFQKSNSDEINKAHFGYSVEKVLEEVQCLYQLEICDGDTDRRQWYVLSVTVPQ